MLTLPEAGRRRKQPYLAIKSLLTPRQIKKQGPLFLSEVRAFMQHRGYEAAGPAFFRYNAFFSGGDLEMEFGILTSKPCVGHGPVRSGLLPSGRYASTIWHGAHDRLAAVAELLIGYCRQAGHPLDVEDGPEAQRFGCRMEIFLDDPFAADGTVPEPRTEVIMRLAGKPME